MSVNKMQRIGIVLWMMATLITIVGSLAPSTVLPEIIANDKGIHFLMYFILSLFPVLLFGWTKKSLLGCLAITILSVFIECGQILVPGRFFDLNDIYANFTGVLTGSLISLLISRLLTLSPNSGPKP